MAIVNVNIYSIIDLHKSKNDVFKTMRELIEDKLEITDKGLQIVS